MIYLDKVVKHEILYDWIPKAGFFSVALSNYQRLLAFAPRSHDRGTFPTRPIPPTSHSTRSAP
jgi:hypothetical protein